MKKTILTSSVLLMIATLAFSRAFASDASLEECFKKNDSNARMKMCTDQELKIQDQNLNAQYKKLMSLLKKDSSPDSKEILSRIVKNQKAWIAMRDTTCDVEGIEMLGGSGEGLVILGCLNRMTVERTVELENMEKYGFSTVDGGTK